MKNRWMNPELLTVEVPRHMAAEVQMRINKLYEEPEMIYFGGNQGDLSRSVTYEKSHQASVSTTGKRAKTKKTIRKRKHKQSYAGTVDPVALYQIGKIFLIY